MKKDSVGDNKYIAKYPTGKINIDCFYTYYLQSRVLGHNFYGQRHPFCEINIILNGSIALTCEDRIMDLSKGQMYFIPANEFHSYSVMEENTKILVLTFSTDFAYTNSVYTISDKNWLLIDMIMEEMNEKFPNGNFNFQSTVVPRSIVLLTELLLIRVSSNGEAPYIKNVNSDTYSNAVNFMKENLNNKITLNDIAKYCRVSNSSLKNIFKMYTNDGVMHYYNGLKMEHAKKLLSGNVPINKIADELGFASQQYFSVAFKNYAGVSPLAYKKRLQ